MLFEGGGKDGSLWLVISGIGVVYLEVYGKFVYVGVKFEVGINVLIELLY